MKKILKSPNISRQINGGSCGPNAMKYVIVYKKGLDIPEWRLINMSCCSEKNGATIEGMSRIAQNFNLKHTLKQNSSISDLVESIEKRNPVIIFIQAWDTGHYVVANGYDDKYDKIFYYDPLYGKIKNIKYETLDKRWHGIDLSERNHFGIFFKN